MSASARGGNVAPVLDSSSLARELGRAIEGEVRFDDGSRALYATDASNYRHVPIGVVLPRTIDDVVATVAICRRFGAPLLNRGAGTSLSGQTCNIAVVVDMSKYLNRVLEVDPERRISRVQPGVVLDDLRDAAERHGLTFAPDPATHNRCTLGGMIGNNSCGVHSVMAGKTDANVLSLDVLTYGGDRVIASSVPEGELDHLVLANDSRARIYRELRELRDRYQDDIRTGFPCIPRRVSGFDLPHLLPEAGFNVAGALVGTEGTCVTVLEATLKLVSSPPSRTLLVLGYGDVFQAADAVPEILRFGPIGLEGMDDRLVEDLRLRNMYPHEVAMLPAGGGWLLVEFGGETKAESDAMAGKLMSGLESAGAGPAMTLCATPAEARRFWELREAGLGVGALVPGKFMRWPGWDDSAVAPEKMGAYLRDLQRLMDQHGLDGAFYGHFGDGCLHIRYNFDFTTAAGVARFRAFINDAADLVVSYGGSLSGEHGDGQAHGELLSKMYGPRLMKAFKEFKNIWDPDGKMNPGKVLDARPVDTDLRAGPTYEPPALKTHFSYADDGGSFSMANLRCVGVGKCRRHDGGTMCPSYMATREEEHSTRGRARLLFEMLKGGTVRDGWRSEVVRNALDLCLACKACKTECPVGVDMATYKAEFLSHYYRVDFHRPLRTRVRTRSAYAMGLIHWWARAASIAPGLVNAAARAPFLSGLIKRAGGIAPERQLPRFASRTFRAQFAKRQATTQGQAGYPAPTGNTDGSAAEVQAGCPTPTVRREHPAARGQAAQRITHNPQPATHNPQPATHNPQPTNPRIILWPDTFNNHFHPETALAAVSILESCGFAVSVPEQVLCCGRPLYDFGMLDLAKHQLRGILRALRDDIRAGTPIVVLEPGCASVFRDELLNLLPRNPDAVRLSRLTFMLGEFLAKFAADHEWPRLQSPAIVHGHCHQKSVLGMKEEESILRALGLEYRILDSGCCGMAGAFGFEENHFDVSVQVGEMRLLPAVRAANGDTVIIADGFSCREQISQLAGRHALHLADVIHMAQAKELKGC